MTVPGPDDQFTVRITARDLYNLLVVMQSDMARMLHKVNEQDEQGEDHEQRLRALERARWPLPSISLVVATVAVILPFMVK